MVVALQLDERQGNALLDWYNGREKELKAEKWQSWNPGDMAIRTLCVQIEAYGKKAFERNPGLFDVTMNL